MSTTLLTIGDDRRSLTRRADAYRQLWRASDDAIDLFFSIVDEPARGDLLEEVRAYSPSTALHEESVTVGTVDLAQRLGWGEWLVQQVGRAAINHDSGKLYVPSSILDKPSGLTPTERNVARGHVQALRNFRERMGELPFRIAMGHHEQYRDLDYLANYPRDPRVSYEPGPDQPRRDHVPMIAAAQHLLAYVDSVEALTSPNRLYRDPMDFAAAVALTGRQLLPFPSLTQALLQKAA